MNRGQLLEVRMGQSYHSLFGNYNHAWQYVIASRSCLTE
jgi:hypothetical protein